MDYWKKLPNPVIGEDIYQTATSAFFQPSSTTTLNNEQIRNAGGVDNISNLIRSTFYRGTGTAQAGRSQDLTVFMGGKNSKIKSTIDNAIKNLKDKDGNDLKKDDFIDINPAITQPAPINFGGTGGPIPFASARSVKRGDQLDQLTKATKLPEQIVSNYLLSDLLPEDYIISHFGPAPDNVVAPIDGQKLRLSGWGPSGPAGAISSETAKQIPLKDLTEYARTFHSHTRHVMDPDGSILKNITSLKDVPTGSRGGGNHLSLNAAAQGSFGLFKTAGSTPKTISPQIGVDRTTSNEFSVGTDSVGNYSKDQGKQIDAADESVVAREQLGNSKNIYDQVQLTRRKLRGGQKPDLSQSDKTFIQEYIVAEIYLLNLVQMII